MSPKGSARPARVVVLEAMALRGPSVSAASNAEPVRWRSRSWVKGLPRSISADAYLEPEDPRQARSDSCSMQPCSGASPMNRAERRQYARLPGSPESSGLDVAAVSLIDAAATRSRARWSRFPFLRELSPLLWVPDCQGQVHGWYTSSSASGVATPLSASMGDKLARYTTENARRSCFIAGLSPSLYHAPATASNAAVHRADQTPGHTYAVGHD
ncbi:hypothetical protein B0H15DRAFT_802797 [Mycena belliarum]|uniref:Uncharacterized protein n=1 Tax=Mycena belliarum TaxID=1033014 RepID=A0AAD6XRX8_9AGAR|nr:hypothetical protein B0H15DRAFT_802797 [Mycena belliae]